MYLDQDLVLVSDQVIEHGARPRGVRRMVHTGVTALTPTDNVHDLAEENPNCGCGRDSVPDWTRLSPR